MFLKGSGKGKNFLVCRFPSLKNVSLSRHLCDGKMVRISALQDVTRGLTIRL